MENVWIFTKAQTVWPVFEGFYFVELAIFNNKDDLYPKTFEITIAKYDFDKGWTLPKEYDNKRVKVRSYLRNKIKLPNKQKHLKEDAV